MKRNNKELTEREKRFAHEYAMDLNHDVYKAALKAGFTKRTAESTAYGWLAKDNKRYKPLLNALVQKKLQQPLQKSGLKAEQVLEELINLAFSNIGDFVDVKDSKVIIKDLSELTTEQQRCLASIQISKNGLQVKYHDKLKALEILAKHFGLIREAEVKAQTFNLNVFLPPKEPEDGTEHKAEQ